MAASFTRALCARIIFTNQNTLAKYRTANCVRHFAKKVGVGKGKKGAAIPVTQRKYLEPETDPEKLCTYVCGGNILKEGKDPEIQPDSEYPEWLWTLRTERGAIPLEELDPDTEAYWRRIRKDDNKQRNKAKALMYKYQDFK